MKISDSNCTVKRQKIYNTNYSKTLDPRYLIYSNFLTIHIFRDRLLNNLCLNKLINTH